MCIFFVVLILFGSFSYSLSGEKCRFDKIYNEVTRFCRRSELIGCNNELNNFNNFLNLFLGKTELFCNLDRIKGYCKSCSITTSSLNDLIAVLGNVTSATGSGSKDTGNAASTSGN